MRPGFGPVAGSMGGPRWDTPREYCETALRRLETRCYPHRALGAGTLLLSTLLYEGYALYPYTPGASALGFGPRLEK